MQCMIDRSLLESLKSLIMLAVEIEYLFQSISICNFLHLRHAIPIHRRCYVSSVTFPLVSESIATVDHLLVWSIQSVWNKATKNSASIDNAQSHTLHFTETVRWCKLNQIPHEIKAWNRSARAIGNNSVKCQHNYSLFSIASSTTM